MYVLLYIFICQLSSAADSENGRKYRSGVAAAAIGWAVAEIGGEKKWGHILLYDIVLVQDRRWLVHRVHRISWNI